jgi:hypothetical protein
LTDPHMRQALIRRLLLVGRHVRSS